MQPLTDLPSNRPRATNTAARADTTCRAATHSGVLALGLVAAGTLCCTPDSHASPIVATGTSTARAGFNDPVVVDFPGIATASDSFRGGTVTSTARASASGIQVRISNTGYDPTGPQYSARGAFSSARDTIFDYEIDPATGLLDDWVQVSFGGALSGSIRGQDLGGTGSAEARVGLSGVRARPDSGASITSAGGFASGGGSVRSFDDSQTISVNEFVSTGYWWVPRGQPVSFSFSLSAQAFADSPSSGGVGTVTVDFSNSFRLNPDEVFDILTPGITANSPSAGIVNNRLPGAVPPPDDDPDRNTVPAPASVWLLGVGLALLLRHPVSNRNRTYAPSL